MRTISLKLGEQYLRMLTNDSPFRRSKHGGWQVEEYFSGVFRKDYRIIDAHIHSFTIMSGLERHLTSHALEDHDHMGES